VSTPGGFDARGAVDLGALAAAREAQQRAEAQAEAAREAQRKAAQADGAAGDGSGASAPPADPDVYPGAFVFAVDEADFQTEVMDRSFLVPVLVDFWAEWCGPCKQLSPVLESLAEAGGGRWVLATVDVDANQRLAQAFQVQSIPTVYAVVKGQPIPLFQGAQPEPQIRQVLEQVLQVAEQQGLTGRVDGTGAAPSAPGAAGAADELPHAPELDDAADAVERGDLAAAAAAYQRLLDRVPGDPDAKAGLALVTLLQRTEGVDPNAAVAAAQADITDVAAVRTAADVLVLSRQVEAGLGLLIESVRQTSGDDRDAVREHLVGLFDVLGDAEPAVGPARRALAAALF
jgi:putative thioredoxin